MLKIYSHHHSRKINQLSGIVHKGIISGLKRGLENLNLEYEYQSDTPISNGDKVLVTSDHLKLRELIETKRSGVNFSLLAGPIFEIEETHRAGFADLLNIDGKVTPLSILNRLDSIFSDKEVNAVLSAGDWAKNGFRYASPEIGRKIHTWYAGVNTDFWDGQTTPQKNRVLVYEKTNIEIAEKATKVLEQLGMDVRLIRYGHYKLDDFRKELRLCDFAVFVSKRETQGLALAEAWAMNVPTLCWDNFSDFMGNLFLLPTSSCPYLTKNTGSRWRNIDDLKTLLYLYDRRDYSPRNWVLNNMTDEISTRNLMDIFNLYDEVNKP